MALTVRSIAAALPGCPDLTSLEQIWYSGDPSPTPPTPPSPIPALKVVIRQAWIEAGLVFPHPPGLITTDRSSLAETESALGSEIQLAAVIPESPGWVFSAVFAAEKWFQDHPDHPLILSSSTDSGIGCLVLTHLNSGAGNSGLANLWPIPGSVEDSTLSRTLTRAGGKISDLTFLELTAGLERLSAADLKRIEKILPRELEPGQISLGSGRLESAAPGGIFNLIHAILAVHRRTLPGNPGWEGLTGQIRQEGSPFYVPEKPRPWLNQGGNFRPTALILDSRGVDLGQEEENAVLIRFPRDPQPLPRIQTKLKKNQTRLIPFSGSDQKSLLADLRALEQDLQRSAPLTKLGGDGYAKITKEHPPLVGGLVGGTHQELLHEIDHARRGLQEAFSEGKTWNSPRGSYFTPDPLGSQGAALVYPGAFNSYPKMGRELFQHFPGLHEQIQRTTSQISHSLAERYLYPRKLQPLSTEELQAEENAFYHHPVELIESGTTLSVLHTLILREIFQLKPRAALGYSLGEISMLWANHIWQDAEESSRNWAQSELFRSRLSGPKTAVREHWPEVNLDRDPWRSYILKSQPEPVQQLISQEEKAFLTIINTPDEVVIAGLESACRRIIDHLGCHALPLPLDASIHNPAMESTYPEFVNLYSQEVQESPDLAFYSAADYAPLVLEKDALAHSIARMTCNRVDFSRLVQQTYQDGIRIYLEVGPQKTCSRWIEKILAGKPHAVISLNKKYQPDYQGIIKVLSLLLSHRVPLDLSLLYLPEEKITLSREGNGRVKEKPLGLPSSPPEPEPRQAEDIRPQPPSAPAPARDQIALYNRFYQQMDSHTRLTAAGQKTFLAERTRQAREWARMIDLQLGDPAPDPPPQESGDLPLFTTEQIQAFTLGDPQDCFGSTYAAFEGRRIPRLPNRELRFIDRVIKIQGKQGDVQPGSTLVSEFDLPHQDWYLENTASGLPYVSLMELALQPCGFLSAYLGTIKDKAQHDFYFRNLDGEATLEHWPDLTGKTITNQIELLSSSTLQETIIQTYSFRLSCAGDTFYRGTSSFGYFTPRMLKSQAGLDGGKEIKPWKEEHPQAGRWLQMTGPQSAASSLRAALPEPERLWIARDGGSKQHGYLYLNQAVDPQDWFFKTHFYQDPVMPGSLGVELISRALQSGAAGLDLPAGKTWRVAPDQRTSWKYRGQITPDTSTIQVDVHIQSLNRNSRRLLIRADANLWKGNKRIYQISDLTLESLS
ncbi:MAG: PfaB family protein [Anaerolineales bacterium]|nr:PfaB family protein [Anaerolineales bacterium]